MRDDSPSRTAGFVAAARHLGHLLPDHARLVDDPYGAAFVSPMIAKWIDQHIDRLFWLDSDDRPPPNRVGGVLKII